VFDLWQRRSRIALLGLSAALFAACGGSDRTTAPGTVTATVSLNPAQYVLLHDTSVSGVVQFPAAGPGGAEYLVVGQFATMTPDVSSAFRLAGQGAVSASAVHGPAAAAPSDPARAFHDMLRAREAALAEQAQRLGLVQRSAPQRIPPPTVGTQQTFKVCADTQCSSLKNVPSTAQFVGAHAAIFVDDSVPPGGFSAADLNALGQQFDTDLYPVDHAAFGSESDVDGNGLVVVLLTKQINALVPKPDCNTSFITGFFFGADITPGIASQYNDGEIFYGMVPDPGGTVSCAYSTTFVKRIIPVTFIHEFQHMISFNQHVLVRSGKAEVLWLNEGMSHLAEELGGDHFTNLGNDTTASRFYLGNLFNAYDYLRDPAGQALVTETPPGSLPERGAAWLFLRWLVDQRGAGVSQVLEQTSLTGAANVAAAAGTPFAELVGRWGLGLYVSDLPSFSAPATLQYTTWHFRTTFGSLHNQDPTDFPLAFPLSPDSTSGPTALVTGTLHSGSGTYLYVIQGANQAGFALSFRNGSGGALLATGAPQLAVIRVR